MKIPAVALAAAFGGGIVLALQAQIAAHINPGLFVIPAILSVAAVVCLAYKAMNPTQRRRAGHPTVPTRAKQDKDDPRRKPHP